MHWCQHWCQFVGAEQASVLDAEGGLCGDYRDGVHHGPTAPLCDAIEHRWPGSRRFGMGGAFQHAWAGRDWRESPMEICFRYRLT
jgi:hypothetical protein